MGSLGTWPFLIGLIPRAYLYALGGEDLGYSHAQLLVAGFPLGWLGLGFPMEPLGPSLLPLSSYSDCAAYVVQKAVPLYPALGWILA